jgi:hypothetical protein
MLAKDSEIPAFVKHGLPRESWRSEPSGLIQLGKAVVNVAGDQGAGSAGSRSRKDVRVKRHYAGRRVGARGRTSARAFGGTKLAASFDEVIGADGTQIPKNASRTLNAYAFAERLSPPGLTQAIPEPERTGGPLAIEDASDHRSRPVRDDRVRMRRCARLGGLIHKYERAA